MWFAKRNRRRSTKSGQSLPAVTLAPEQRKRLAVTGGIVLGVAAVSWALIAVLDRPLRHVEVTGHFSRVSPVQVEQAVMAFARDNVGRGFVSLRLDALKAKIEEIAWVDTARIERRWPDGVRVTIVEQTPGARWGEHGLLNSRGELFLKDARFMPPELPQLDGPDGTEPEVARLYLDTYPRLAGVGLRLARVALDPRGAWELEVTSTQATAANTGGIVIRLGRQDVAERLDRFVIAASPLIAARPGDIRYVDMRYSNGFAVGWNRTTTANTKTTSATHDG